MANRWECQPAAYLHHKELSGTGGGDDNRKIEGNIPYTTTNNIFLMFSILHTKVLNNLLNKIDLIHKDIFLIA
jgi:hypothetical protein